MKDIKRIDIFLLIFSFLLVFVFSTCCVKLVELKMTLEIEKIKHK